MKIIKIAIIIFVSAAFLLIPLPAADVRVRLHFSDTVEGSYALYYATDSAGFSQDTCIMATNDEQPKRVTFRLDNSLEGQITRLRVDFPAGNNLWCIDKVTLSSAGFVQKQYDPNVFFSELNAPVRNDITTISYATAQDKAYVLTDGEDPFLLLSEGLVADINDSFSHLHFTRLGILLFVVACYFMYRKNLFSGRD